MGFARTRSFYAKDKYGDIYNFLSKAQRDQACKKVGLYVCPANEAYKSWDRVETVDYHDYDSWEYRTINKLIDKRIAEIKEECKWGKNS